MTGPNIGFDLRHIWILLYVDPESHSAKRRDAENNDREFYCLPCQKIKSLSRFLLSMALFHRKLPHILCSTHTVMSRGFFTTLNLPLCDGRLMILQSS
jgi:hypothetical protein